MVPAGMRLTSTVRPRYRSRMQNRNRYAASYLYATRDTGRVTRRMRD